MTMQKRTMVLALPFRQRGLYEDAVYEHTRAATLFHDRPRTHMNLGIALAMSEQFDWAIRAFSVAAELAPENPLPHRWLTKLYRRVKKDDDKAREHARVWAQLRKDFSKNGKVGSPPGVGLPQKSPERLVP